LSGSCPIWGGYLADIDCRYDILTQAGDDRTPEERQRSNLLPRCSSTPLYLSDAHNHLNDIKLDMNENVVSTLIGHGQSFSLVGDKNEVILFLWETGMSPALARHFGYIFMRDPLVVIKEHLHSKDDSSAYHFEVNLDTFVVKKNNLLFNLVLEFNSLVFSSIKTTTTG
jgi:glutamate--cysteine ligase catalytic subunit